MRGTNVTRFLQPGSGVADAPASPTLADSLAKLAGKTAQPDNASMADDAPATVEDRVETESLFTRLQAFEPTSRPRFGSAGQEPAAAPVFRDVTAPTTPADASADDVQIEPSVAAGPEPAAPLTELFNQEDLSTGISENVKDDAAEIVGTFPSSNVDPMEPDEETGGDAIEESPSETDDWVWWSAWQPGKRHGHAGNDRC